MTNMTTDAQTAENNGRRPSLRNVAAGYFLGVFGANMASFPLISLLMYYLTDTVGVSIALATAILTIPKIWDMIIDPTIGALSDRYARRRGSRSGVFMLLCVTFPASACGAFLLPPAAGPLFAALCILLLIIKSSLYTIFLVGHVAAADDIGEAGIAPRNAMLSLRIFGQAAGGLAAGAMAPVFLELAPAGQFGFGLVAASFAVVGFLGIGACSLALRCVPVVAEEVVEGQRSGVSLVASLQAAWRKPKSLGLIVGNLLVTMAGTFIPIALPFINKYSIGASDAALAPMFTSLMAMMLAGSAAAAWLSRYLGTNGTYLVSSIWLIAVGCWFYPASASALGLTIVLGAWGFGMGLFVVSLQSSLMDEAKSARNHCGSVGLFLGLLFAGGKLGDTLGGLVTGAILSLAGGTVALASGAGHEVLRIGLGIMPPLLVLLALLLAFLLPAEKHGDEADSLSKPTS